MVKGNKVACHFILFATIAPAEFPTDTRRETVFLSKSFAVMTNNGSSVLEGSWEFETTNYEIGLLLNASHAAKDLFDARIALIASTTANYLPGICGFSGSIDQYWFQNITKHRSSLPFLNINHNFTHLEASQPQFNTFGGCYLSFAHGDVEDGGTEKAAIGCVQA